MNHINLNGIIHPAEEPILHASNRAYRYGDGLFETLKINKGKILLKDYHFERLFKSLALLKFEHSKLDQDSLESDILDLCERNNCLEIARTRLSLFRGHGNLHEESRPAEYLIECLPAGKSINEFNEKGLDIDIYPLARKSIDAFSNLKSANFLPYVMAARYARENQLDDCLVLNTNDAIADATIANVFIINGGKIRTPSLKEGCIAGVMRRCLIEQLRAAGFSIEEDSIRPGDLESADEVFLTNALQGIRWVRQFRDKSYSANQSREIYQRFVQTIRA